MHVGYGRGSVLLRQRAMLCTSGFVDNIIFSHNGLCGTSGLYAYRPISKRQEHNSVNYCGDSNQILFNDENNQDSAHRGRSLLSAVASFVYLTSESQLSCVPRADEMRRIVADSVVHLGRQVL